MPDEDREWTLDGTARTGKAANDNVPAVRQCVKCYAAYKPQPVCPQCGHHEPIKARVVAVTDGELTEITAAQAEAMRRDRKLEIGSARTIEALEEVARKRGYKHGWARFIMKSREGKRYG